MIDFGFDKLALIGAVALIVIGPEKLPRVARTVGHLLGKAQRYMADVKAEVNRSIELEELKKMKGEFEHAVQDVKHSVEQTIHQTSTDLNTTWLGADEQDTPQAQSNDDSPPQQTRYTSAVRWGRAKKNWRIRRSTLPQWYKQRQAVRVRVQSGAARVARFRPPRA
jgi:sec-independent protein translocase protein TatB